MHSVKYELLTLGGWLGHLLIPDDAFQNYERTYTNTI